MHIPSYLKKGDTVGILSTARKINEESLYFTAEVLRSWGLHVKLGNTIGAEDHQFAGTDVLRAADLQAFLADDSVQAILCARGGYGTVRIIDEVDFGAFIQKPKWICGFSDVTVLHNHLQQLRVASIHSSMPSLFPKDKHHPTLQSLHDALFGKDLKYEFPVHPLSRPADVDGLLTGGNLSILYALQGSVSAVDTTAKILFLEDLDEYLYHVDRMMIALDRAGKLSNLKAMIIGGMTAMKDNEVPFGQNAEEIILHYAAKYNYPVFFGFPAGHTEHNYALKLGTHCHLRVHKDSITFQQ